MTIVSSGTARTRGAADDEGSPRRLALDVHKQCPTVGGIAYRSRPNNRELCFALFDRVATRDLSVGSKHPLRDHRADVDRLTPKYGAVYDLSSPVPPPSRWFASWRIRARVRKRDHSQLGGAMQLMYREA
jgi:hypothetical protein